MSIKSYQSGLCFPILLLVLLLRQTHREGPNTSPSALPLSMFSFQLQTIYKFCSLSCDPHPCFSFLGYFFLFRCSAREAKEQLPPCLMQVQYVFSMLLYFPKMFHHILPSIAWRFSVSAWKPRMPFFLYL